jgi:hypothetical protein
LRTCVDGTIVPTMPGVVCAAHDFQIHG